MPVITPLRHASRAVDNSDYPYYDGGMGRSSGTGGAYADGKRKSSMGHARHAWTCSCGRVLRGNGGKASHQRACDVWARAELRRLDRFLVEAHTVPIEIRIKWETKRDELRTRLGLGPG
jgi:hypothetical protein